jgi:tetraacyldisaccharide 4'-kinase
VADPNRTAAGVWAKEQFGITAFILDDGFQHRRLQRDLNVVCIDTADPFGEGKLLPAGRLREPVENLSRANAVILMRADSGTSTLALRDDVRRLAPSSRIFEATRKLRAIRPLSADDRLVDDRKFFVFAGLGGSTAFATWIARQGIEQAGIKQFRDHHRYTQPDVRALEQDARSSGANALLTTAKDAVKLAGLRFDLPCFVVEIQVELDDPSGFASLL